MMSISYYEKDFYTSFRCYKLLDDIRDYTLKDLQDAFSDFNMDTGLEMNGSVFFCHDCGRLHLMLEISRDRTEDLRILQ